ncbi:MAG TPA: Rieske 2Fe-2S domain-containing protein [Burkholderiales bacterium]|nr:Rieske 2Fe-2S domain-containing protein [Burkholderiales bacterium]
MSDERGGASSGWLHVCRIDQIARPGVHTLALPDLNVAVFQLADGRMFGIEDRCPHRGARLSAGVVYDSDKIACLDHGWGVRLTDGGVEPPERGCVRVFPVKVEDGAVLVLI